MGLLLAAIAAQSMLSSDAATYQRSQTTMVSLVEFQNVDVRDALKTLFRKELFGGTINPSVQGVITISLRNVPFDTALQNITRQVDATYRIDHGFFEIVPRTDIVFRSYDAPREATAGEIEISSAYAQMANAVALGKGSALARRLASSFEMRNATETKKDSPAIRALVDLQRSYPRFAIEKQKWRGEGKMEYVVSYARPQAQTVYYRDFWQEEKGKGWVLTAREETVLSPTLKFVNAPLSHVLKALGEEIDISWTLAPSLDRLVTVDLTGLPFETALQRALSPLNATYFIEAGVYHIVPHE